MLSLLARPEKRDVLANVARLSAFLGKRLVVGEERKREVYAEFGSKGGDKYGAW